MILVHRSAPCALAAAAASLLCLAVPVHADTIEVVVRGDVPKMQGNFPDTVPFADNWISQVDYADYVAMAMPWSSSPVVPGDSMRMLVSFDADSGTAGPDHCGYPTRLYSAVTGTSTVAGVVAVFEPGATLEVATMCNGSTTIAIFHPASGPSLQSDPWYWNPSESMAWLYPSVEMPMLYMSLTLLTSAACLDANATLPTTTSEFLARCTFDEVTPSFMGIRWGADDFPGLLNGTLYDAYFHFWVYDFEGAGFTVEAPTTEDYVDQLVAEVMVLNLDQGIQNSLDAKIAEAVNTSDQVAIATYATTATKKAEATASARNRLGAFINAVEAQRGKAIPDEKATRLIELANRLAARL